MKITRISIKILVMLVLVALVASTGGNAPVQAQGIPTLSVYPVSQTALTCDTTLITIRVADISTANGLYAYDVRVGFTPGTLEILEVTNGSFLDTGQVVKYEVDNTIGQVWFVYTQLQPSTPKSGSGDLLYIKVRALTPGITVPITINYSKLSTVAGVAISHLTNNGSLTTSDDCPPAALSINPSPALACLNQVVTLSVDVRYAVNLWSYNLDIAFSPDAIEILTVTNGGFLEQGFGNWEFNNTAGTIAAYNTQINPQQPKTGSGSLIVITLRTKADRLNEDVTMVINTTGMFPSELINSSIESIPFSVSPGLIYTNACDPTAVDVMDFTASGGVGSVTLNWRTANERDHLGFNLYRANSENGPRIKLNTQLIRNARLPGGMPGGDYEYIDTAFGASGALGASQGKALKQAKNGRPYYYWLEAVDIRGGVELFGPVQVRLKK